MLGLLAWIAIIALTPPAWSSIHLQRGPKEDDDPTPLSTKRIGDIGETMHSESTPAKDAPIEAAETQRQG